jgi:hypothetical protein
VSRYVTEQCRGEVVEGLGGKRECFRGDLLLPTITRHHLVNVEAYKGEQERCLRKDLIRACAANMGTFCASFKLLTWNEDAMLVIFEHRHVLLCLFCCC